MIENCTKPSVALIVDTASYAKMTKTMETKTDHSKRMDGKGQIYMGKWEQRFNRKQNEITTMDVVHQEYAGDARVEGTLNPFVP